MRTHHLALRVSDLDRTKAYYLDTLGLEAAHDYIDDEGVHNYFVTCEDGVELQFVYDPDREDPVSPSGIDHLTFAVDDVDALVDRIAAEWDVPLIQEPTPMGGGSERVAFVGDPDGYAIELIEFTG